MFSETYHYFDLPFCRPGFYLKTRIIVSCNMFFLQVLSYIFYCFFDTIWSILMADRIEERKQTVGEALSGDRLVNAPYKLQFLVEKFADVACTKNLTTEEVSRFRTAIKSDYYLQMYYDNDLPIWEFVGEVHKQGILDNYKYFLYTHICFDVLFNKDRVIEIKVHVYPVAAYTGAAVDLTEDKETFVKFVYSVFWKEVDIPFEKRREKYSLSSMAPHNMELRWFLVLNSCVTLLLFAGFLVIYYMRVVRKDLTV